MGCLVEFFGSVAMYNYVWQKLSPMVSKWKNLVPNYLKNLCCDFFKRQRISSQGHENLEATPKVL